MEAKANDIEFLQLMNLGGSELWNFKENDASLNTGGALEVLFNKDLDLVVLKINNFKYALDQPLHIIGSSDNDQGMRSYLLPSVEGCYVLHVGVPSTEISLVNFETFFEKCSKFIRDPNLVERLKTHEGTSNAVSKATTALKEAFIKGSDLVSGGVAAITHKKSKNPNHVVYRKIEAMKLTDKAEVSAVTLSKTEVLELTKLGAEIAKRQSDGFWNNLGPNSKPVTTGLELNERRQVQKEKGEIINHPSDMADINKATNSTAEVHHSKV